MTNVSTQAGKFVSRDLLGNAFVGGRKDRGQIFDQMRPIARLLQLLNDCDHDVIIDTLRVDFANLRCEFRRRWRSVFGCGSWVRW